MTSWLPVAKKERAGLHLLAGGDAAVGHFRAVTEVVEVKAGYARNYLLPNSLATIPTPHNLRLLDRYKIRVLQARDLTSLSS